MEIDEDGLSRPAARPCLALACVLGAASFVGRELGAALSCLAALAGAAASLCLLGPGLLRAARARRGAGAGRAPRPTPRAWLAVAGLAALVLGARGDAVAAVPLGVDPGVEQGAVAGTWRRGDFGRHALVLDGQRRLDADLFVRGTPPADGEAVLLLPPFEIRAPARGPVAGSEPARARVDLASDQVVRLGGAAHAHEPGLVDALRATLAARAHALPEPPGRTESGLAAALVVNDRSRVDAEVADLFKRTGTLHLLAISGMHVVLFAFLVAVPLRRVAADLARRAGLRRPWPRRVGALCAGTSIAVFAAVSGGEPPVVRAAVAAVVALLVRDWPRDEARTFDTLSLLALGLALELVVDPLAWTNVGLALSYSACLGLALATRPAADALSRLLFARPVGARIDPLLWHTGGWRLVAAVLALWVRRTVAFGLGTSVAATLATLPLQWALFGEFSPVGIVATALVGPLMVPWLPALWLGVAAPDSWLAAPAMWIESLALWLLESCDRLPGTSVILPERPALWLAATCALALAALVRARRRDPARRVERCALVAGAVTLLPWTVAPRCLELWALDVGHGTCVVGHGPGLPLVVFDAGTTTRHGLERHALRPLLSKLDATGGLLVVSHLDRDHSSGVRWLARRGLFAHTAGAWPHGLAHEVPHLDVEHTPGALTGPAPDGERVGWRVLRGTDGDDNEGSRNLELEHRGARVVLCGDATGSGLLDLAGAGLVPRGAALLLLAHHGRYGSGSAALLAEADPELVWVSSETHAPLVLELERRGLDWRGTFVEGPLGPWRGPSAPRPPP